MIDTDLGLANIDLILGITPEYHLGHFFSGERSLSQIVMEGPGGLRIIAGGSGFQELADISEWQLDKCLQQFYSLEKNSDIILFDTGAGISNKVLRFVVAAKEVMVVTTPEPTAIADAYGVIKVLARENSASKVYLVVNMVHKEDEGQQVMNRLVMVAEKFLDFPVEPLGMVFYDPVVTQAVKLQQPFSLMDPHCKAARMYKTWPTESCLSQKFQPSGFISFWRRLVKMRHLGE